MTQAQLNLMVRVISRRVAVGEEIGEILQWYPRLTPEEAETIRNEVLKKTIRKD